MLCAGGDMINVGEPLSVLNRQTILRSRVDHWFTYINEQNEGLYLPFYRDAAAFRTHPILDIKRARLGSPRDPYKISKRWASFLLGRVQRRGLLIRDPFAVFSINWFARRLGCQVVVIVRHPLAVVASVKRLGLTFDFRNLLDQPSQMHERLEHFRPDIETMDSPDVVDHASLLWRIVYQSVAADAARDSSLCLVRHEDLSREPLQEYARLYELLGLSFNEKAKRIIEQHTSGANPKEGSLRNPFKVRLDSRANLINWRHRLDDEEIDRVLRTTRPVADKFYPDEEEREWTPESGVLRGESPFANPSPS